MENLNETTTKESTYSDESDKEVKSDTLKNLELNIKQNGDTLQRKTLKKPGRTLLLNMLNDFELLEEHYINLSGFKAINRPKTSSTTAFLIFDTVNNGLEALKKLRIVSPNLRVKFSYYKIFFAISGLTNNSDYNEIKDGLINYIQNNTRSSVLYCKLYRKNDRYIGCGDLTIDTLKDAIRLTSPTDYLKDFYFGNYTGTFYKYTNKKTEENQPENAKLIKKSTARYESGK